MYALLLLACEAFPLLISSRISLVWRVRECLGEMRENVLHEERARVIESNADKCQAKVETRKEHEPNIIFLRRLRTSNQVNWRPRASTQGTIVCKLRVSMVATVELVDHKLCLTEFDENRTRLLAWA